MTYSPIREPDHIRRDAACKLRKVPIGDDFRAMLGCLLGEHWTSPKLIEMIISPDGHMLGRLEDEDYFANYLGLSADLLDYIHRVAKLANLDGDEIGYLVAKVVEIKRLKKNL